MRGVIVVGLLLALTAWLVRKTTEPDQECLRVFEQRDGLFNNWRRAAPRNSTRIRRSRPDPDGDDLCQIRLPP